MIESVSISGVATYGGIPEVLQGLSKFNYLYGSNGSGKTTISRVIADANRYPTCNITWRGGTPLECLVYNQDFIDKNFNQPADLKGVFTLGEKQVETLKKIDLAKGELDIITSKIEKLTQVLQGEDGKGGKKSELSALETKLKETCWAQKNKYDGKFQVAFKGFRGSAEEFKTKIILELQTNSAELLEIGELEKKAKSIFGATPTTEQAIPYIAGDQIIAHEGNQILKKKVIGKEDVDIAAMIKKLGNSDWVRDGRIYFQSNDGICPFCQQGTSPDFATSLDEYFDETFDADSKTIDTLIQNYRADSERIQKQLTTILSSPSSFLDIQRLQTEKDLFDSQISINTLRLAEKKKEPSKTVELESCKDRITSINEILEIANTSITKHNAMVTNLSKEKKTLTAQIWRFLLDVELKTTLATYKASRDGLDKAISSLMEQITKLNNEKVAKINDIRNLEKLTTSVQPTIDGINGMLSDFGFHGFKLAKSQTGTSYKLIRNDNSDAKSTLSEGEKNFLTFLYFYHLLKGSDAETGIMTNRVVVFDDPVSSLDSDILFIVGSLLKSLFEEVRSGSSLIKQVFMLTHNVYFHKEVTFNKKRGEKVCLGEETFWIVRKVGSTSRIDKHSSNPIKTSYDLLWSEVRKADHSSINIQNTLRRILENYFKFFGGIDPKDICSKFTGKDQILCNALLAWINDGSHFAQDDIFTAVDETTVNSYLRVFREIFEKSDHGAHYKMMMGEAYIENSEDNLPDAS